jgi:hypothetical protein
MEKKVKALLKTIIQKSQNLVQNKTKERNSLKQ